MALIISLGTNLGNKKQNFLDTIDKLSEYLELEYKSNIYFSKAVDYENQPDFYNQVLQFKTPKMTPLELISKTLNTEKELGRVREIDKGPRTIDIDILFWDLTSSNIKEILLPHPRLFERSFICLPLMELPYYQTLKEHYNFPTEFSNEAFVLE